MDVSNYKDLVVWKKSMSLVVHIYKVTRAFPPDELYGLVSQMRRAAVSIPSNLAEGSRRTGKDQKQFFKVAYGSGSELETQIELSRQLKFIGENEVKDIQSLLSEIQRMLNALIVYNLVTRNYNLRSTIYVLVYENLFCYRPCWL